MKQDISIIIEWENILLSEADRALEMLKKLKSQLHDVEQSIEVLFLFNEEDIEAPALKAMIDDHFTIDDVLKDRVSVHLMPVVGLHYYDIKNAGVQKAQGELIIFLDSDVIPEKGWLKALTEPFLKDASVQVVAGHTYLDPEDTIAKAFALGWFFPIQTTPDPELTPTTHFFANNVAFRRAVITQHPFPSMPKGVTRGACVALAKTLVEAKIPILKTNQAQTFHPRPNGLHHIIIRGLATGRDHFLTEKAEGVGSMRAFGRVLRYFRMAVERLWHRFIHERHLVGTRLVEAPVILMFMTGWHALALAGGGLSSIAPKLTQRLWRI